MLLIVSTPHIPGHLLCCSNASHTSHTYPAGRIQLSSSTHSFLLASESSRPEEWQPTGGIDVKGKGRMLTFLYMDQEEEGEGEEEREQGPAILSCFMEEEEEEEEKPVSPSLLGVGPCGSTTTTIPRQHDSAVITVPNLHGTSHFSQRHSQQVASKPSSLVPPSCSADHALLLPPPQPPSLAHAHRSSALGRLMQVNSTFQRLSLGSSSSSGLIPSTSLRQNMGADDDLPGVESWEPGDKASHGSNKRRPFSDGRSEAISTRPLSQHLLRRVLLSF